MQVRTPAVAGMFYPKESQNLKKVIKGCFLDSFGPGNLPPTKVKKKIFGVICPHAGFVYSGAIACNSYYSISSLPFDLAIIIGPNHWGIGSSLASMKEGKWSTPIGDLEVSTDDAVLLKNFAKNIEFDFFSHSKEHSIEVQIPILVETFKKELKILPIMMADQEYEAAKEIGVAISKIAMKKKTIIIGSSDFTHYEENEFAHEQDTALIQPILNLDIEGFYKILHERRVSACGYGAIASTMIACKELGAKRGELLRYATSGDVTGDKSQVVGYASIIFT